MKIHTISVFLIFAFALSACGGLVLTPTPQPVTLRFAFLGSDATYQALADDYHATHPHITI